MFHIRFISAVGTPVTADQSLDHAAFEAHIEDQLQAGIHGLLIGGTMGLMQMLPDSTYRQLVEAAGSLHDSSCEILVGVGDTSFPRTLQRIELTNAQPLDAIVILTPYFYPFNEDQLVDYYTSLADLSRHPVYLYDLPEITKVKLSHRVVERVAEHPNIHGIKASCEADWSLELMERMGDRFRVIVAQPHLVDTLSQRGVYEHLDGIFALAPAWTVAMGRAIDAGDRQTAARYQQHLNDLLDALRSTTVHAAFSAILNARGIPGFYAPLPIRPLGATERKKLLDIPVVQDLLAVSAKGNPV